MLKKGNHVMHHYKHLVSTDKSAKGFLVYQGFQPMVILNRLEQLRDLTINKENQFMKSRKQREVAQFGPGLDNIFWGDYNQWKKSRKLFHNFFSFANVKMMVPNIITISENNLKQLAQGEQQKECYLMDVMSMISGQVIFSLFCGDNQQDLFDNNGEHLSLEIQNVLGLNGERHRKLINRMFKMSIIRKLGIFSIDRELKRRVQNIKEKIANKMRKVIVELKDAKETESNKFMLQVRPQLEALLEDEEKMVSEFMIMFIAGTDTTSHVLHNILLFLYQYPETKEKVLQEMKENIKDSRQFDYSHLACLTYLDQVIKETLRLNTPAPGIVPRQSVKYEHVQLGDLLLHKDSHAFVFFDTTLQDQDIFPQPKTFDTNRWSKQNQAKLADPFIFTPFSMGARSCIGERLSLLEMKTILVNFLMNFDYKINTPIESIKWIARIVLEPQDKVQFSIWKRDLIASY